MNFAASLAYLDRLGGELRPGAKFELGAMRRLLAALGDPQRRFAAVHVAGTNGKGSTAALIESAARQAGHRTGLYTSPHLERITERIRIAGREIGEAAFARLTTRVVGTAQQLAAAGRLPHPPSFFETLTAIGFLAFAESGVELAVVEVGLGGRLDATNVLHPVVAVLTPIGLDHQAWLGKTVTAIATEKAGILKRGVATVVSAPQPAAARRVVRARCSKLRLQLEEVAAPRAAHADGESMSVRYLGASLDVPMRLPGAHQRVNARVALAACAALDGSGWRIPAAAVVAGFGAVTWPGRLELARSRPPLYLDGAHNRPAAAALARFLREMRPAPVLVFGCLGDKPARAMARLLFPHARAVVLTAPSNPRAAPAAELSAQVGDLAACRIVPQVPAALAVATRLAGRGPVVVAGSLYLVGEARAALRPLALRAGA